MEEQITFEELKQKWTPEITKRAVELAEGFCFSDDYTHIFYTEIEFCEIEDISEWLAFPLLLHRAVEGWNKEYFGQKFIGISYDEIFLQEYKSGFIIKNWIIEDYLPCHLTACEMVIMDCLSEVLR